MAQFPVRNIPKIINAAFDRVGSRGILPRSIKGAHLAEGTLTSSRLGTYLRFTTDIVFSSTDEDTAAWTTGTINWSDGTTTETIVAGNTGNITATTYVYYDGSETGELQTTTTPASAVGDKKILIAIVETGAAGKDCKITTIGAAGLVVSGITANQIAANVITTSELNFTPVQSTDVIAKINASAEGIKIEADNITIAGTTTFTSGWAAATNAEADINVLNTTNAPAAANADVTSANTSADTSAVSGLAAASVAGWAHATDATKIDGGDIYTNTVTATQIAANTITATEIAATTITGTEISSMDLSTKTLTADTGTVGGWTLGAHALTSGSAATTVGLDNTVTAGDDIRIYAGNATPASAPFRVTEGGALVASSGTVGGWTLSSTQLNGSNIGLFADVGEIFIQNNSFESAGIQLHYNSGSPRFYVGNGGNRHFTFNGTQIGFEGANCSLTGEGLFTAANAVITGNITATSGSIAGSLIAGTITGVIVQSSSGNDRIVLDTGDSLDFYQGGALSGSVGGYAVGAKRGIAILPYDGPEVDFDADGVDFNQGRLKDVLGESNFSYSTYTDPHSGTAYAIKVGGGGIAVGGNSRFNDNVYIGNLSKGGGSFLIPHPDPSKSEGSELYHSFVESPTAGDNLYRYKVKVKDGKATIKLPDYFEFLNENPQAWVTAVSVLGYARAECTLKEVTIMASADGEYNVLVMGTRKDSTATIPWERHGVELIK